MGLVKDGVDMEEGTLEIGMGEPFIQLILHCASL
jgi:hypothetical protein